MKIMNNKKIERISHTIISILLSRFDSFPEDSAGNRNSPFHEAFLNAFTDKFQGRVPSIPYFITMSSWLHGLNTTLGQTFFERTAHILSDGDKKEYTAGRSGVLKITQEQSDEIGNIISELYNGDSVPNIPSEENRIYSKSNGQEINATGFSVDVYFETDNEIVAIEMKSVKPNSGEMRGEKKKILEGKAALKRLYPNKDIKFYIGFPFDPTGDGVEYDKARFARTVINLTKSFALDEMLIADELWNKLSGVDGTMQKLLDIINCIATPDFKEKYDYINNPSYRDTSRYKEILSTWNLYTELYIVENIENLISKASNNRTLQRLLNGPLFDNNGNYKVNRISDIKSYL